MLANRIASRPADVALLNALLQQEPADGLRPPCVDEHLVVHEINVGLGDGLNFRDNILRGSLQIFSIGEVMDDAEIAAMRATGAGSQRGDPGEKGFDTLGGGTGPDAKITGAIHKVAARPGQSVVFREGGGRHGRQSLIIRASGGEDPVAFRDGGSGFPVGDQFPDGRRPFAADDPVNGARQAEVLRDNSGMDPAYDDFYGGLDLFGETGERLDIACLIGISAEPDDIGGECFHDRFEIGHGRALVEGQVEDPCFMIGPDSSRNDFKIKRLQVEERMKPLRYPEKYRRPNQ